MTSNSPHATTAEWVTAPPRTGTRSLSLSGNAAPTGGSLSTRSYCLQRLYIQLLGESIGAAHTTYHDGQSRICETDVSRHTKLECFLRRTHQGSCGTASITDRLDCSFALVNTETGRFDRADRRTYSGTYAITYIITYARPYVRACVSHGYRTDGRTGTSSTILERDGARVSLLTDRSCVMLSTIMALRLHVEVDPGLSRRYRDLSR